MDDMYNIDLKQRFINERAEVVILPKGYLNLWFEKVSRFEFENNKDVSNFTFYEIVDMYKTLNLNSIEVLRVLNSQLSKYTQWCLQQNLVADSQNHFMEIKQDTFADCVNILAMKKKYITREQVLSWARELKNPSDSFIFLALFEGIRGKLNCELVNLKISDFHDDKVALCTGREITISPELYNMAIDSNETTKYYGVSNDTVYKLLPEDLIIKNYPNIKEEFDETCASKRIQNKILRNAKYLGIESFLTANTLRESGIIDFIQRRTAEIGEITCQEYISKYKHEIENQYDCIIRSTTAFYNKYREYLE